MKLRVVNSFVCVFRVEFALPCFAKSRSHREEWKQPEISGWLFCTGDLSQLVVSRLSSLFYLDLPYPFSGCAGSGVRVRVDGAGKTSSSPGFEPFSTMDVGYQEHDCYDL